MPDPTISQMSLAMYSSSGDAASRLEIAGMFDIGANAKTRVLFLEALVRSDDEDAAYEMQGSRRVTQYIVRRGFGIRIVMQVAGWSGETSLSVSSVAAKSQVEGQSVQYTVETLGLPDELEREVLDAVGVTGPLNEKSFVKLRLLITQTLPAYLRRTPADAPDAAKGEREPLGLAEYRVPVETSSETVDVARSIHFAMTHIARGDSLARAKEALRAGSALLTAVGSDVIEDIYQKHAGIGRAQEQMTPPADAVNAARSWLNFQPSSRA
jgi:hypothetical protein